MAALVKPLPEADMRRILAERAALVENFLEKFGKYFPKAPQELLQAMLYSLKAGGKRLRPVLCLSCAALFGLEPRKALPFAAAIEMIHTYSLIHDDLPAMDNDDLRRGKPSCHKVFGEAGAILAGDALQADAFFIMAGLDLPAANVLAALAEMARAAGSGGMAGGQMLDMIYTGRKDIAINEIKLMQALKTGAILRASCLCGALLAGAEGGDLESIGKYGAALGQAFQIADDILDLTGDEATLGKPVGSDERSGKNTYPSLLGLEESRRLALEKAAEARTALAGFSGGEAAFLLSLADYAANRSS